MEKNGREYFKESKRSEEDLHRYVREEEEEEEEEEKEEEEEEEVEVEVWVEEVQHQQREINFKNTRNATD